MGESNLLIGVEHSWLGCLHRVDEVGLLRVELAQRPDFCWHTRMNVEKCVHVKCSDNEMRGVMMFLKFRMKFIHDIESIFYAMDEFMLKNSSRLHWLWTDVDGSVLSIFGLIHVPLILSCSLVWGLAPWRTTMTSGESGMLAWAFTIALTSSGWRGSLLTGVSNKMLRFISPLFKRFMVDDLRDPIWN